MRAIATYTDEQKKRIRYLCRVRSKNYYERNKGKIDSGNTRIKEAALKKAIKKQCKMPVDKTIKKENRRLFRKGLNKAIVKINRMRQSRMIRLKDQCLSYKQRVLLAIDYYYELVRQNTMKAA